MTDTIIELSEDAFDAQYPLRRNHLDSAAGWDNGQGGCLFETYGQELAFVRSQDPRTVWTLIDGGDGDQYVLSGFHLVNRIGYLISTVLVPEGTTIEVRIPMQSDQGSSTEALERGPITELRHILGELLGAAGDLDAAIDGVTDQFDAERDGLNTVIRMAQAILDGGTEINLHQLLASRRQIAVVWSIEDVQEIRPDLSEEQAWEVLQQVKQSHDCNDGVNWLTLETIAEILFGDAPETATEEE